METNDILIAILIVVSWWPVIGRLTMEEQGGFAFEKWYCRHGLLFGFRACYLWPWYLYKRPWEKE